MQTKHSHMIWRWRNAPKVRSMMFHSQLIDIKEHQRWFIQTLKDDCKHFYIVKIKNKPFAMVSFQTVNEINRFAEWGFYKAPNSPQGIAIPMLNLALQHGFEKLTLDPITSRVRSINHHVLHLHEQLGFTKDPQEKSITINGSDIHYYSFSLRYSHFYENKRSIE